MPAILRSLRFFVSLDSSRSPTATPTTPANDTPADHTPDHTPNMPVAVPSHPPTPDPSKPVPIAPSPYEHSHAKSPRNNPQQQRRRIWTLPPAFHDKYRSISDNLGSGGSGHIFSATRRSDSKQVAVKLIPRSSILTSHWIHDPVLGLVPKEAHVLRSVHHPHIISFIDYFESDTVVLIVMQVFGSSWACTPLSSSTDLNPLPLAITLKKRRAMDLFELLEVKSLTEKDTHAIFSQIIHASCYLLAQHNMIHGDIKDENILIEWSPTSTIPKAKLIDFGGVVLNPCHLLSPRDFTGTLEFAPPQVIRSQPFNPEKAETWALGVLLYSMLNSGAGPFATPQQSASGGFRPTRKGSPAVRELIDGMLTKDERERLSLKQICDSDWVRFGPGPRERDNFPKARAGAIPTSPQGEEGPRGQRPRVA
ncbi:kinase-like domain-containing protein [Phlyctochytrium arcticum]|nr:kinase-like domain-containing protein [Phlyctochytrium arcticum]